VADHERLLHAAQRLVGTDAETTDVDLVREAHPADLAHVLQHLAAPERNALFRSLGREQAGDVLSEMDDHALLELIRGLDDVELSRILEQMPAEHAADVVDELPTEQAEKILDLMEEQKSEEVQGILEHPDQSAGRLMSSDVVALAETATVELLEGEVVSVRPEMDREDVARLVAKYDLVSLPVVDEQNRLLGAITVDDVIDIVQEEASEDIFRIAGSDAAELERRTPYQVALLRLPWVLTTLLIELFAGWVIHAFDRTLAQVILLASFMPVIQAISGNTGLQSVTMVVRGLATGQVQLSRWWEPLRRQAQTSSILGAGCALVVGTVGLFWHSAAFAFVVAVSMFISVNLSGMAGTVIPMFSKRLGFDPALTAGPFETAFQDVLGVTIFLSLATALLRWLM
jgi:magnesium transporter